ncbi:MULTISPECIES: 7,8-didemethyl-8-hydroxy-5-deazariboflavin synthase subunit CofG [Haloferax]|uniref:7,8-didemethyl-8-hydroxy-5-deazariboflavin synthase n=2 Tax=Haloferax TaxID=2251 RepID=A0A6G1Z136_9EURY|nr:MULTISPECIES: 7,8-didemethyl-8-hydroxy-5-deazariboflavin synthase subunit CofG [Haloferax]KAB1187577.1 7,8-didemethyl-8-hydroxy-5-deazariboflavin synthase subunit CofG [Haloferax sp. CBA1149]MRW80233.1 7,8-didemethyl-8-hydroxy-5-deazariboflavin synthase subunit CofG [Haloferax marinisediminis]
MFPGADEYGVEVHIDDAAVDRLLAVGPDDVDEQRSSAHRTQSGDVDAPSSLSFSRNVFLPLTTACRYTCTYCTYYDVPGEATLMSLDEVRDVVQMGADAGCTEALFTFGDAPDERYTEIHRQLDEWGYDDILEYLVAACEVALDEGLLPHSNPGDLTREQFESLAPVNASMGVMLETTADVAAHAGNRRKTPGQRLNTIRAAGEEGVPFTTGILVGIGETWRDRAESLLAIRALHERYGHIQEVIVQNVVPNDRSDYERPSIETMRRVVSMARVALPEEISVQVPPNLSEAARLVDCGVDDLGGVSPVTDDYVNPEYAWPALQELADIAEESGVPLRERLPVYARYLPDEFRPSGIEAAPAPRNRETWIREPIADRLRGGDVHSERLRHVAHGDGPLSTPET